jgi:hypothetical protein
MSGKDEQPGPPAGSDTDPPPTGPQVWIPAAIVLAVSTVLFNAKTVAHVDQPRAVVPAVAERYRKLLDNNDTTEFLNHLRRSVAALRRGKVYFPVSDYDCPVTYLLAAGAMALATGWPLLVVHNLFFLAVFYLNGLSAFAFLRSLVRSSLPALLGALAYQGCNYVLMCHYMGHMNNAQIQWIPLVFLGLCQTVRKGASLGWAALLGVAAGLQVLSSSYYTVFLATAALPVFGLAYGASALRDGLWCGRDLIRFALWLAFAAALAALVSGFYLIPRLGSPPKTFQLPWWRPFVLDHYLELLDPSEPALFVGLPPIVLAVLALRWWYLDPRPLTTAFVVTAAASLLLMLPAVPGTPYWFYYHLCPMFKYLRVPLRFFPIVLLMLTALNTLYLDAVFRNLGPARRRALAGAILCSFLTFNWLSSPWVVDLDLVSAVKRLLGHKSPAVKPSPEHRSLLRSPERQDSPSRAD